MVALEVEDKFNQYQSKIYPSLKKYFFDNSDGWNLLSLNVLVIPLFVYCCYVSRTHLLRLIKCCNLQTKTAL